MDGFFWHQDFCLHRFTVIHRDSQNLPMGIEFTESRSSTTQTAYVTPSSITLSRFYSPVHISLSGEVASTSVWQDVMKLQPRLCDSACMPCAHWKASCLPFQLLGKEQMVRNLVCVANAIRCLTKTRCVTHD